MKSLIAYYSRKDENYLAGKLVYLEEGNTSVVAKKIAKLVNADLFLIEQENPYSKSYNECINEAQKDLRNNSRPKLKKYLDSIDEYDVIYLGFPNYWGDMPMAVYSFLEHYDFKDKIIKPFCTHEGSKFGNSLNSLKKTLPNSIIKNGLAIVGSRVNYTDNELKERVKND